MTTSESDPSSKKWQALIGIGMLSFVGFIDFSVVNTILPGIQRDLQASIGQLQWVMNGFCIMLCVFMVTMGRLGDIFGRRRVLYIGVLTFGAASLLAGVADDPLFLIACRVAQGITAAITFTCAPSLVTHHFPKEEQGRALGIFMSITGVGLAIGPVLGGFFLSLLSWRWAFYVNVPVIMLGFLIAWPAVKETPRQADETVDWLGLALFVPGLAAIVTTIMEGSGWGWFSTTTLGLFAFGVVCLIAFVFVERRVKNPIIDFGLLRHPLYLVAIAAAISLGGFITVGNFFAPLYLMNIRNEVPYIAGFMLLPISGLVMIVPALIGNLADRLGPLRFILAGQALLTIAAVTQMQFETTSPAWFVLFGLGLFGLGWGLQQATTANAATAALPASAAGLAIGALYTFWNLGSSFGLALAGLVFKEVDREQLWAALDREDIVLTSRDQGLIRSLLSDPSEAQATLSKLTPGLESKVLPLFQDSFMAGYGAAMWYLVITCGLGTILVFLLGRRALARED